MEQSLDYGNGNIQSGPKNYLGSKQTMEKNQGFTRSFLHISELLFLSDLVLHGFASRSLLAKLVDFSQ